MFIENIIEAKNKLGISTVEMSRRSKLGLTEKTISRVLSGKTIPHVDTALDIGETVGLSAMDLFGDTKCFVADQKLIDDLKAEISSLTLQKQALTDENRELKLKVFSLSEELLDVYRDLRKKEAGG